MWSQMLSVVRRSSKLSTEKLDGMFVWVRTRTLTSMMLKCSWWVHSNLGELNRIADGLYSHPLISSEVSWFQGPLLIPKLRDAQVPDIKWCGICI